MAIRTTEDALAYVDRRVETAEKRDKARDDKFDRIERMRFRQHTVPVPDKFKDLGLKEVKTHLVNEVLRIVDASIVKAFPRVSVPPRDLTQKAREQSGKMEKWSNSALQTLDGGEGGHRAYADGADYAAMFGLSVPKLVYLPDTWDNKYLSTTLKVKEGDAERDETSDEILRRSADHKKSKPLPFAWLTPDPRTVHPWFEYRQLTEVVEVSQRTRDDILNRFERRGVRKTDTNRLRSKYGEPIAESALGKASLGDSVKFVELWTRDEVLYLVPEDRVILDRWRHGYGRPPYFPFFGLSTASRAPEYEAMSVVDDMLDLIEALDANMTMLLHYGYLSAYPMGFYRRPPTAQTMNLVDAAGQPISKFDWEPLTFRTGEPGADMSFVVLPPSGQDIYKTTEYLMKLVDRAAAIPDVMRGEAKAGTPAWGLAQLLTTAKRIFDPITDNYSTGLTPFVKLLFWLIEHKIKTEVYAETDEEDEEGHSAKGWLGLGPDDLNGYHACSVEIATLTEDRRIQEGQFGMQLWQSGAIDLTELLEAYLHYDQPEEMQKRLLVEKYHNSPQFQQRVYQTLDRLLGQGAAPAVGASPEQMAALQAGVPPEGEMPPEAGGGGGGGFPPGTEPIAGAPAPQAPTPGVGLPIAPPMQGPVVG